MAMGREGEVQSDLVLTWAELPRSPGHAFYDKLQNLLAEAGFDALVETTCKPYYAPRMGAPSLPPASIYARLIPRCAARSVRNRAESRIVPDPITRSAGTPCRAARTVTICVMMSTGFDATRKTVSGTAASTAGTISAKIAALRDKRSSQLSPGFWLAPAASTTTRAPSRSADSPARTRRGSARGVAS